MYLIPFTDHPYYLWQAVVQAVELRRQREPAMFLAYYSHRPSRCLLNFSENFPTMTFRDWRKKSQLGYNPAMKPWLVSKFLRSGLAAPGTVLTLIDPDAIPLVPSATLPRPREGDLLGTCTDNYTGKAYLCRHGAWEPLCALLRLDPRVSKGTRGIGAQYRFLPSLDESFWDEVARMSVSAFSLLEKKAPGAQPWCAEMYVTQMLAIRYGYRPRTSRAMDMLWASDTFPKKIRRIGFFHNAGVTQSGLGHFSKTSFQLSPFGLGEKLRKGVLPTSASNVYIDLIRQAEDQEPKLIEQVVNTCR